MADKVHLIPDLREKTNKRRKEWAIKTLPAFEGMKAFVLPGAFYGDVVQYFAEAGFERAKTLEDAEVVVFIGGADIDPSLYGEKAIKETQTPSRSRDQYECEVYDYCVENKVPMFGICRGAQFLAARNGGSLWQHVDHHAGCPHAIYDIDDDSLVIATSLHHQMIRPDEKIDIIAVCNDQISKRFLSENCQIDLNNLPTNDNEEIEIEAGIYWETQSFFVQGHPEIGSREYRSWCMHKFQDFVFELLDGGIVFSKTPQETDPSKTPEEEMEENIELWRQAALM